MRVLQLPIARMGIESGRGYKSFCLRTGTVNIMDVESKENISSVTAIGVVALPSPEISELAISLSKQLENAPFNLGPDDYLPHITLAMGFVQDLDAAREIIGRIAGRFQPISLTIDGVATKELPMSWEGEKFDSSITVLKDPTILKLHRNLVDSLPFMDVTGNNDSFITNRDEKISQGAIDYVAQFKNIDSEWFSPHITLGSGRNALAQSLNKQFDITEIALCKLGNFCTARQALARWKLPQAS